MPAGTDTQPVVCEAGSMRADLMTVDALARLQLAARRSGCEVELRGASDELLELLDLCGLGAVFCGERLGVRRCLRQAEEGKQPVGVEERHLPGDPPV